MAGGAGERGDGGASSSRPKEPPVRLEDVSLNTYVLAQTYLLRAVTGLGYLALTWSTVVLLGGFVTSLLKTDFWCITVISMIQAARSVICTPYFQFFPIHNARICSYCS